LDICNSPINWSITAITSALYQYLLAYIKFQIGIICIKTPTLHSVKTNKMVDWDNTDKTHVRKGKIKQMGNDFLFWQSQCYEIRLEIVEKLHQEYNFCKFGPEHSIQKVYRIIKRK
jgi:hypothetical protein